MIFRLPSGQLRTPQEARSDHVKTKIPTMAREIVVAGTGLAAAHRHGVGSLPGQEAKACGRNPGR